ncbi:MAG TPA: SpvB/TcaC N-terminal domain-containing protein [Candidatus Limnocylindrales bacterium]|nr:SpvB/TcaC N-terminal domain-containing protein [Candidatus Limnocylindrales bacterium]
MSTGIKLAAAAISITLTISGVPASVPVAAPSHTAPASNTTSAQTQELVCATVPQLEISSANFKLPDQQVVVSPTDTGPKVVSVGKASVKVAPSAVKLPVGIGITALSARELPPLDPGLTNVTGKQPAGYQFTPHPMQFTEPIAVMLPYDPAMITEGFTAQDIYTYFFDEASACWKPLYRVEVDEVEHVVTSLIDHFTTMINATMMAPEHPEGADFNPNEIKGIQVADPGEKVNLIAAPMASNSGDNRLSYPIEVPPGREGMQPDLALMYDSAKGNGWVGVGWDLPTPSITIDTRWGVPRYDAAAETETYLLNGEQLTPVAHRATPPPRSAEKVFHTRREGAFARIVRHGTAPGNYTWEVVDRNGGKWLYGSSTDGRLSDGAGNIYLWALQEARDTNGNLMRFRYSKVDDTGIQGGTEPGTNLYPQSISYTGRAATEGRYTVTFVRDRQLGEPLRADKQIDARGGFKRVTADLLRKVEVAIDGSLIRRYEFGYTTGAFHKKLLASVTQFDAGGAAFNTHRFDYFDDIRDASGAYQAFQPLPWTSPDDGLSKGELNLTGTDAGRASAINANTSVGGGGHLYTGVGTIPSKAESIGLKTGFSFSDEDGLLALVDVDGDSLPDKVFRTGGQVFYRKNLSGPKGQPRFDATAKRLTLPGLLDENASTVTLGLESYLGGIAAQLDFVNTFTTTSQYFTDVNGDEIMDLVNGSTVLFGRIGADGVPVYGISADTPVPIGSGTVDGSGLFGDFAADRERFIDSFPLLDTVRRWIAPFDGQVEVQGAVRLSTPSATGDGVRVAIQHEDTELWSAQIGAQDTGPRTPTGVSAINVTRGQHLYFRVQSNFDGANDVVAWDPIVQYRNVSSTLDVNGLDAYRYQQSREFTLGGRTAQVEMPLNGTVRHTGNLTKLGATTDDVTVVILADGQPVYQRTLPAGGPGLAQIDFTQQVHKSQVLKWRVQADSPIDLGQISWVPRVAYTAADGVERVNDPAGNPLITFNPPYEVDMYPVNDLTAAQESFGVPATATIPVQPELTFDFRGQQVFSKVVFTVKARGALRGKAEYTIGDGMVIGPSTIDVPVQAGDELFFDFSTTDPTLRSYLTGHTVRAGTVTVPSAFHSAAAEDAFPQPYRGWAAVGYNGNRARANAPIAQADLVIDENFFTQFPTGVDPQAQRDAFAANPRINPPKVAPFLPDPLHDRWAAGERSWASRDSASSSRLGTPSINTPRTADLAGTAVPRMSRSQQISLTGGVGFPGGSVGGSVATGDSTGQLDYLDLNGDMFPDAVGANAIQYSDMFGGLGAKRGALPDGAVRKSSNVSGNASAGSAARTIVTGRGQAAPTGPLPANTSRAGNDMPPLGVGGSLGGSTSDGAFDLLDVNGDTLPDRVYADGRVALNLGYRFGAAEPWRNGGEINDGAGSNFGINIGFNTDFYGFAGGASYSEGNTSTATSLMDVNGDGLLDRVFAGTPIRVGLNTGNGFEPPVPFNGSLGTIATDRNATLGGGAYFTIPICFLLVTFCVIINPGGDFSTGASRSEFTLRDINGDGYADHLSSNRDSELTVASNKTGRTNLLRGISRPLGASMQFDYGRDGNDYGQPQSHWVLTRYTVHDGHTGDGVDTQATTYEYDGGVYDRLEREFFGYGKVTERHLDGQTAYRSVVREYLTDSHYTMGLLRLETSLDGAGRPFIQTQQTYTLTDVFSGTTADPKSTTATVFPALTRAERRYFEGQANPAKSDSVTMEYDAFGNTVRTVDTADVGPQDDLDTRMTYTVSDPDCVANNIVGTARTLKVFGNGTLMRDSESIVDCVTGNVTQARAKLAGGEVAITDLEYFDNGNLKVVTGPPNRTGQRYRLDYLYDNVVETHIQSITDSFGYRSTATHDLRFGSVQSATDFNNQTTRKTYDAAGRLVRVVGPYEVPLNQVTIDFEYHPEATVPYAITRHIDKEANGTVRSDTIDTITFIDGMKRVVQMKQDATLHSGPTQAPVAAMTVSGRTVYDFLGRPVRQFYPVSEPKSATNTTFNPAFDTAAPTVTDFDILDRPTRMTYPDATVSTMSYGFGPDRAGVMRFEQVSTDANGKSKRTYRDTRRLTTAVKEFNPAGAQPVIWTSYSHDALSQPLSVTDDRNNVTTNTYDNFGRHTVTQNPDAGRIQVDYDLADNPIRRITSKLAAQSLAIEYDYQFNRLSGIRYPLFTANNVSYTYGAPGAANNGANRVTAVTDGAGTVAREYGPLGEITKETRTTTIQGGQTRSFTTQWRYDTWTRTLSMTYPDGEVLTYHYDSGGQVDSATGVKGTFTYNYLRRMQYDKFGQRVLQDTGNATVTTYAYDPADRRLSNLQAKLSNGYTFQNLRYTYDDVGNVTSIQNDTVAPSGPDVGMQVGGPSTQTFRYDDLYRLTHAEGSYAPRDPKVNRYRSDFTYDTINNITRKTQTHELVPQNGNAQTQGATTYDYTYTFAGGGPHAASTIGPFTIAYDANGNLISQSQQPKPRRQMIWDEENRLACSHENVQSQTLPQTPASCDNAGGTPNAARYKYDDEGERVVKDGSQFHLYPNRNYSTRGNHEFKHIYVGDAKLITKVVEPTQRIEDRQYYSHADHLGSTSFVTGQSGGLEEHLQYFPGGETWVGEHPSQPVPQQFTGKELDPETGLYYFGARYYDPRTQRWQTPDPVVEGLLDGVPNGGAFHPANLALYTYAYNHPVNLTDPMGGPPNWSTRAWGAVKLVGGVLEAGVGIAAGAATSWTGVGAVVGGAVAVHGFDVAWAGARQLVSGKESHSFTSQTMQRMGVSKEKAEFIDNAISFVGTLGASGAIRGASLAAQTRFAGMGRVGSPVHLVKGRAWEKLILAKLGLKQNNSIVLRPDKGDVASVMFQNIVGKPQFTEKTLEFVGTRPDSLTGGIWEVKSGFSTLELDYQIRLQVYFAKKLGQEMTLVTQASLSKALEAFLKHYGIKVLKVTQVAPPGI